jgi:Trk K+ transport system NAD-binding subunit
MIAIVAGTDGDGLGEALEAEGVEVRRIDGLATGETLESAGLAEADLFVLTDTSDATAIPVAKDANPEIRVVLYARDSLPEFATGQADLAVDPALLSADVVAEELVDSR